jgi:hypothetical protein
MDVGRLKYPMRLSGYERKFKGVHCRNRSRLGNISLCHDGGWFSQYTYTATPFEVKMMQQSKRAGPTRACR